jgi:hypothetical protein
MTRTHLCTLVLLATLAAAAIAPTQTASAGSLRDEKIACMAGSVPWHGNYYHVMWGQPVALVVPPTAARQSHYSWGVANTRVTPIWHQFQRPYPGAYVGPYGFYGTPQWPSSTDQFGVYYVRGPW